MGCPEAELSLSLVDDQEISRLNSRYLGRSGPTNVISFPMQAGQFAGLNPDVLGDVVMSVETAARESVAAGFSLEEMLDFYLIHGILHLFGYDHEAGEEEALRMEAKTRELWEVLPG
ncbi:MAG: rRNA maturation RNase YbeY [Pseudomonadota bacterium]